MKTLMSIALIIAAQVCHQLNYLNLLTASLCTATAILILFYKPPDGYKYPPGPTGLPIVGQLPWMVTQDPAEYFNKLSRQYGNVLTVRMGQLTNNVVSDFETIKEFTNHPDFQDRPNAGLNREIIQGYGIGDSDGLRWKHQRRFIVHHLRDFGMGKLHFQDKIMDEFDYLVEEIKKSDGKPFSVDIFLQKATCNVMFNMAFGKRFDYDDPEFIRRLEILHENVAIVTRIFFVFLFPALRFLVKSSIDKVVSNFNIVNDQVQETIADHKKTLDENNPRDLIDLFLIEMKTPVNEENKEYLSTFSERQLEGVIHDLFAAGTETSSMTIKWALVYMLNNPDIQEKVQAEIDDVIGQDRSPSMDDKLNMPFTTATLQETERLGSITPWGLVRSNNKAAEFKGYKFPPHCMFFINIYGVHRDEKFWKDPYKFDPMRFIDSEGKVFRPPYLIPFGSGKRNCPGESLGRMEVFLLFTTLMQKFKFTPAGETPPSVDAENGVFRRPKNFSLCAHPRFQF